jgi:hypothetical protein
VYVTYYDQGVSSSGDLMQSTFTFSNDGGLTWSKPSPLMSQGCGGIANNPLDCRAYHGGYGNDTSQPNLGDYNSAVSFNGNLYAVWAGNPRLLPFNDGQPDSSFTVPDFYFNKVNSAQAALDSGVPTFTDSGGNGFIDAGDQVRMQIPLRNYVTNSISSPVTYSGITATLTSSTPGISILAGSRTYPNISPGTTASNSSDFVFLVSPTFVPGTRIEFRLNVSTAQGSASLLFTQFSGTPVSTTLFSENFNSTSVGVLPPGWAAIHAGGANTVPWITDSTFCGATSNALFHANANDGPTGGAPTRFERASSPNILVPSNAEYVTIDFDVCYDTEDAPQFNVWAYDGGLLRITDFTTGRFARATLVEAFAETLTTGTFFHYPRHGPRNSNAAYFQDMSMWAGDSGGFRHVSMRLPGMQGATIALRPDYTQDSTGTCTNIRPTHTRCGIMIDNIVMRSVVSKSDELLRVVLTPAPGSSNTFTGVVTAQAVAGAAGIPVTLSGSASIVVPPGTTIPAGSQTSAPFTVTVSPAASGFRGTVTATGPSNARSAGISIF